MPSAPHRVEPTKSSRRTGQARPGLAEGGSGVLDQIKENMIQELVGWTRALQSLGNPWVVTIACAVVILVGSRIGAFYTPPSRIASVQASGDEWAVLRFVTDEAVKNSIFFGATTLLAVRWDRWWLTVPAGVILAVIALPTIFQDAIVIFATIPTALARPHYIVPIVSSSLIRLSGDAVSLLYLALIVAAVVT